MSGQEEKTHAMAALCRGVRRITRSHRQILALALRTVVLLLLSYVPASTAVAANGPNECADESLRAALGSSALPDCRAYEMVTPAYKEGYPLTVESLSSDGERMIDGTIGTLVGNLGSGELPTEGALYLDERTAEGWRLEPLNAPSSQFVGEFPLATEVNDGQTLWEQHTPAQPAAERGLYIRSSAGAFSFVGPLSPNRGAGEEPSNLIDPNQGDVDVVKAATSDYGHIVMEAKFAEARWPFDETPVDEANHSLYEYSGLGNKEPILVDVVGEKGSRQLITLCGVVLGSGSFGSSFNTLSNDGEVVFFTVNPCNPGPPTAEVYARLHGALTSAKAAETIDVSSSECTVGCGESPSGKQFEGASEDGRVVFFTSTQKLTNDAVDGTASGNAAGRGGCPRTTPGGGGCNLYMYDFDAPTSARLEVISVGGEVLGVTGMVQNGSHVYYVSRAAMGAAGKNPYGKLPVEGQPNLYVYDVASGRTAFVTTLGSGDGLDWNKQFIRTAQVSGSGRDLLFESVMPGVTPDDRSEQAQLFEYRSGAEGEPAELVRVTKGENGFNENGNTVTGGVVSTSIRTVAVEADFKSTTNGTTSMSADGQTVFFLALSQLSERATASLPGDQCRSLYEFHASGSLVNGSVHLISDGRDTQLFKGAICGPQLFGVDETGTNVLFATADPLLPSDVDGVQRDVYDARVNGGFAPLPALGSCGACGGSGGRPSIPPPNGSTNEVGEAPMVPAASAESTIAAGVVGTGGSVGHRQKNAGRGALSRALRVCRAKPSRRRAACERDARRRLGVQVGASHSRRSG